MFKWLRKQAKGRSGRVPSIPLDDIPPTPPVKKPRQRMPDLITGEKLVKQFQKAGMLPDNCRRMVIDASADKLVIIYYECYGDERIIDICVPDKLNLHVEKEGDNGIQSDAAEDKDL